MQHDTSPHEFELGCRKTQSADRFGGAVLLAEARTSDVDLLVQFFPGAKTYDDFFALSELIEARLGRTVELGTVEALSPFLGPHILAEAEDVLRAT